MKMKFILSAVILSIFLATYAIVIETSPLPYNVIDRDGSGVVSFLEAVDGRDIGKRESSRGSGCVEYFWLKDGLPAYEQYSNNVRVQP